MSSGKPRAVEAVYIVYPTAGTHVDCPGEFLLLFYGCMCDEAGAFLAKTGQSRGRGERNELERIEVSTWVCILLSAVHGVARP